MNPTQLTESEIRLILNLLKISAGVAGYSKDKDVAALQAKLSILLQVSVDMRAHRGSER